MKKHTIQLNRMQMATLVILYEVYPLALSTEEIMQKIMDKKLIEMSEEEFEKYMKNTILIKNN